MNQRSPVAVHSLRDARACHACHAYIDVPHAAKDVPPWYSTPQNESLHCQRYKEKKEKTRTDELLPHRESCSCLEEEENQCTGRPTAPLRGSLPVLVEEIQCTGRPTAPIITRYRCFLPDLAGLAGLRRVGPGTGTILSLNDLLRRPA